MKMADIEFTKMSSKGQVVIPRGIREEMNLRPGTPFAVMEQRDTILLKRIEMPKKVGLQDKENIFKKLKSFFTEEDV